MTAVMRSNEQQCRISCFPGLLEILSQVIYPKLLQHHRPRAGTAVHHPTLPKNWNHLVCNDIINMYVVMCSNVKYCDRACDIRGFECMGSFTDWEAWMTVCCSRLAAGPGVLNATWQGGLVCRPRLCPWKAPIGVCRTQQEIGYWRYSFQIQSRISKRCPTLQPPRPSPGLHQARCWGVSGDSRNCSMYFVNAWSRDMRMNGFGI